jgi:nitroreductase
MTAPTLLPIISGRYSPFAFTDQVIEDAGIRLLFEAAGRAPSSFNDQPWQFLYATKQDPENYKLFFECLAEGNKKWAFTAPVLSLVIARTFFTRNHKPNKLAFYETGMAVGNLMVQAMSMGIYLHQIGGYDKAKAKLDLDIPEGFEPLTMMAIGYPGDPSDLPQELLERANTRTQRKPVDDYTFIGKFPGTEKI